MKSLFPLLLLAFGLFGEVYSGTMDFSSHNNGITSHAPENPDSPLPTPMSTGDGSSAIESDSWEDDENCVNLPSIPVFLFTLSCFHHTRNAMPQASRNLPYTPPEAVNLP